MDAQWKIELFNGLCARRGERRITRFRTQKTGALLAYLAFHRDRFHSREALIDLLWPDCEAQAGRHNLSVALSSLRHQMEPPGVPAGSVIVADRYLVGVNPAAVTTDVAVFEAALQATAQATSAAQRLHALTEAVDAYRGELLRGYYEEWVAPEQRRLEELFWQALDQLINELEQSGEVVRALHYARRGVQMNPLREESQRRLMRLYAASGQWEAALQQFEELERLLYEQLNAQPDPVTRQLAVEISHLRIQTGEAVELRPAPPAVQAEPFPLPSGIVTFLLTDLERAALLQERNGEVWEQVLQAYGRLVRQACQQHGGRALRDADGLLVMGFARPSEALMAAVQAHRALIAHPWPVEEIPVQVRMALYTGEVDPEFSLEHQGDGLKDAPSALQRGNQVLLAGHGGQILCSEATASLLPTHLEPGLRLLDLGTYRLEQEARPERLFQVEYPEIPRRKFPPLKAASRQAPRLPLRLTRFFGREEEMTELEELLLSDARLVTLTGVAGSGKTRLALEVAEELAEAFQGAVYFVSLADLTEARWITEAVWRALQLFPVPGVEPIEQVVEVLSRGPALLVLDNLEHLMEGGPEVVWDLLQQVPGLVCLVTSRQSLGLEGEREFIISPLPVPRGETATESLAANPSVQLFVDRAQAVMPDFQVTDSNAAALTRLCDGLEGIPLALELAAARAKVLSPAQMAERLQDRFSLLVSRRRNVPARHLTLEAALDWSYGLLPAELQRFFAQLSVFRGGCTLEAAQEVCQQPLALDYLEQLRESSLVSVEAGEEPRYRCLETLRAYGAQQLEKSGQGDALRRRHCEYYLRQATRPAAPLDTQAELAWLTWVEGELGNLRAALEWALEQAPNEALRLADQLGHWWVARGHWAEGRQVLAAALACAPATPVALRASALRQVGQLAYLLGDYEQALAWSEQALALSRQEADPVSVGRSLSQLGRVAWARSDNQQAQNYLQEAEAILRQAGAQGETAAVLAALAAVAHARGERQRAHDLLEESLGMARAVGDQRRIAAVLNNLGVSAFSQGNYPQARERYQQSLALQQAMGDRDGIATSLNDLGTVAAAQSDHESAHRFYQESLALRRELGDRRGMAAVLHNLGMLAAAQGDYDSARYFYQESRALRQLLGDKRGLALTLNNLGDIACAQGDYSSAQEFQEQGLQLYRAIEHRWGIALCTHSLADLACARGDYERAQSLYEESLSLVYDLGDRWLSGHALKGLGDVACGQGDASRARDYYMQSLLVRREIGDRPGIAGTMEGLARVLTREGKNEEAARWLASMAALREALCVPLRPNERADYQEMVSGLRASLGEAAFQSAWEAGRMLDWQKAIEEALQQRNGQGTL